MNKLAIFHEAKSSYAYAYDKETLHITIKTARNDFKRVRLIYGDPFKWEKQNNKHEWDHLEPEMELMYQNEDFDYYFIEIKPPYLRTKYAFILETEDTKYFYGTNKLNLLANISYKRDLSTFFNFPFINEEDLHETPTWVKDTVWYQIFLDRFYSKNNQSNLVWGKLPVNNNEFYGGNLTGVIEKLPYLANLGITGIYFTPLFKAYSAHKYDTEDYFLIDPAFGTNADFKVLVKEAHKLNIKVMLDGVFNHAGFDHPFFQDVIKNGEKSIYKNSFFIKEFPVINFPLNKDNRPMVFNKTDLNFQTFAFTPYMPKWNTNDKLAEKHLLDVVKYWITEYDIDGWRLDVSNEISHDFLRKIKETSRKAKKDTFILGENWDQSTPWLQGDQLDSVMNYSLSFPIWNYFSGEITLQQFKNQIVDYLAVTPKNVMENMFNLIGSHDTIRIKRRLNEDVNYVKQAFIFMFLSSGAPNIYYGDEIGLTGEHDPDNRRCMIWDESKWDLDFYNFIKQLITLRNKYPDFKISNYNFISNDILAFTKNELLVVLNDNKLKTVTFPQETTGKYLDLLTNKNYIINIENTFQPYDSLILIKEK